MKQDAHAVYSIKFPFPSSCRKCQLLLCSFFFYIQKLSFSLYFKNISLYFQEKSYLNQLTKTHITNIEKYIKTK